MTLDQFRKHIFYHIRKFPKEWRKGQKVFNYIDAKYGVARFIQYSDDVDCFYNDNNIDEFIKLAYKYVKENPTGDDKSK